jgi:hypothetical protein
MMVVGLEIDGYSFTRIGLLWSLPSWVCSGAFRRGPSRWRSYGLATSFVRQASPASLIRLLRRARHHPLDLHILLAAANASPTFCPDHGLTSLLVARLAASCCLLSLQRLLQLVVSHPCPCADKSQSSPEDFTGEAPDAS